MNAIIYVRVSTDARNARTIDDQIASCRERCELEGWAVVDVFADRSSGRGALDPNNRPGLCAMLERVAERVAERGIDRVVAQSKDRIARTPTDASALQERITLAGARLVTLSDGDAGDIAAVILALFDAAVRRDRVAKVKRGKLIASAASHRNPSA